MVINKAKAPKKLTPLGKYLAERSVNKSEVCRKIGISLTRLNRLCYDEKSFLRSYELQLIAMAINVDPAQMQKDLFGHLMLKDEATPSEKLIVKITDALTKKDLFEKHKLALREIERIADILPFCTNPQTDDEIVEHIGLKRKSPKFISALKASVEAGWLILQQSHKEGKVVNTYTTTDKGREIAKAQD